MAVRAVGLKTYIWNNHLKSLLFLLLYPLVITPAFIAVAAVLYLTLKGEGGHYSNNGLQHFLQQIIYTYWYVPYVLLALFLSFVFVRNTNRLNVPQGMTAITRENHPKIYEFLERLCISRGLEMPFFYLHKSDALNAYTSGLGPHSYCIVVTTGLVQHLSEEELECVLAHELTHMINGDTRLVFLTGSVTHMFASMSNSMQIIDDDDSEFPRNSRRGIRYSGRNGLGLLLLALILKAANIGAFLVQLLISRKREYIADAGAVELTKNPQGMIAALRKIGGGPESYPMKEGQQAALFHHHNRFAWFQTHPSIEDRIAAIRYHSRVEPQGLSPWSRQAIKKARESEDTTVW